MCKLGDIIVIKEFKNEIREIIKRHSFVVINDEEHKRGDTKVEKGKKKIEFDKDFWTKKRPHVTKKEMDEDIIPFKWSKDVLSGKKKAILSLANHKNN